MFLFLTASCPILNLTVLRPSDFALKRKSLRYLGTGAYEQEHATPLYFCHGIFIDRFNFRSNLL